MADLAPIAVSTYGRVWHLQRTVEALQRNPLAKESRIFFFSDAPRKGDEEKVAEVRRYLKGVGGFGDVSILERTENDRVKNNRGGMKEVLDHYGRIIFLEEDVVAEPGFLEFMNQALSRYEHDRRVFSVTGWCPKFRGGAPMPEGGVFFMPRFSPWGLGIWRDRFEKIQAISADDLSMLQSNPQAMSRIQKQMGPDVMQMIVNESLGLTNALDIRCCFHQAVSGELTLYPYPSLTRNIGLDGTGEHCGIFIKDINGPTAKPGQNYAWPEEVSVNPDVAARYIRTFTIPIHLKAAYLLANKAIQWWKKC
ncbi:MAG: hypothetical protein AB7U71_24535 [Comamonas sp.]